jgi:hypothetical protein
MNEFWWGVIITLIVGIPVAYGIAILANIHTPRFVQFRDKRKLLRKHKTREQALRVFNRVKAFHEGPRDRYPFYIILASAAVSCAIVSSTLILIAFIAEGFDTQFRFLLFSIATFCF